MDEAARQEWQEFDNTLRAGLLAMGLTVPEDRLRQMFEHYRLVVAANRQFNLTRITSPTDAAVKHYADSLSLLATPWAKADTRLRVLDVGTGAGYPAVPLAAACPAWSVTAIDGTGKKTRFVEVSAAAIGLANLNVLHARAADLVQESNWRFDLVVVRAVGRMDKVLTETLPLLGSRGAVVFYKTVHAEPAEVEAAAAVARRARLVMETYRVDLPLGRQDEHNGQGEHNGHNEHNGKVLARQLIRYRK